jgi:hypothetical protein
MSYYARLDGNKVVNIEVASKEWIESQPNKDEYVEYTLDNPASKGGDYVDGFFYQSQPFESWVRDGKGHWISPIPQPENPQLYYWNEETLSWELRA